MLMIYYSFWYKLIEFVREWNRTVYKQILINSKTELTGRSPLGRQRSALGCGAI